MKREYKNRIIKDPPVKQVRQEIRQTKSAGGGLRDKINAHRDVHAHALFSSLGRLVASPFTSIMTIAVLAIAISLASGFYILVNNLQQLTGNFETSNQISLFLRDDVSDMHANKLANNVRDNINVKEVKLITREQALADFKSYSGFGAVIERLEENPLPIVIEVLAKNTLDDKETLSSLFKSFQQYPEVDFAQMDTQWVERLQSIVSLVRLFTSLVNMLLAAAVLFIIGNTVRLELHARREEVVIAKLVGATNSFIYRPFLYTGFWIGFLSGMSAWFIVTILMLILRQSVEVLSELYGGGFHLMFLSFSETLAMISLTSFLGVLGSWVVLICQLQNTRP
ncbi:MAG: permease-like cell division protein FtsX [Methylococcales bacterium]|jgi:cell division transport system permease protein